MTPRVSCLLTVYNASAYLREAIQSVFNQTFEDWQLVILNDGSTDPLVAEILSEATYDQRVLVFSFYPSVEQRARTARYATLVNVGVTHATGDYLCHLAGDDHLEPDWFARGAARLDAGASVVYGAQRLVKEDGEFIGLRPAVETLHDAWHRVDYSSVMYLRPLFDEVGGWDDSPKHWRDADAVFWRKLTNAGHVFEPVAGRPTGTKRYRGESVDARVIRGETPW
jgi:glycosyltransferase involved in cell wall biosynthesis